MLNETVGLTPFGIIDVNGKPHIASPLNLLSQGVTQKVAYLGSRNRYVRGIPVREWQACARSYAQDISYRITISFSSRKSIFQCDCLFINIKFKQQIRICGLQLCQLRVMKAYRFKS